MAAHIDTPETFLGGTRVLVMGLGSYGGGRATARWLAQYAEHVTVTDMRDADAFSEAIAELSAYKNVSFVLGEHRHEDFRGHDMVVVNPGVPIDSSYLKTAQEAGARIENDASLFFRFYKHPVIAISGTRGKSTTAAFAQQLLNMRGYGVPAVIGNNPAHPLLSYVQKDDDEKSPVVAELSSWQLEFLPQAGRGPEVATLTNLYRDHQNRHASMEDYAEAKSHIFTTQNEGGTLILNYDDAWTPWFLNKDPQGITWFFAQEKLPASCNGLFCEDHYLYWQGGDVATPLFSVEEFTRIYGVHNRANLMAALLSVWAFDPTCSFTEADMLQLVGVPYRQEEIFCDTRLRVINDSAATSPDATQAAIARFATPHTFFIVGGTDKELDYHDLAESMVHNVAPDHLMLLSGSATEKLKAEIARIDANYARSMREYDALSACVSAVWREQAHGQKCIVFSPGAASFEKFKNEFDRGEQFARIIATQ